MNLKIVLPAIAGLGLTLSAFKPIPAESMTSLKNENLKLQNVSLSNADVRELNELTNSAFVFKKSTFLKKNLIFAAPRNPSSKEVSHVNDILAKYE